MLVVSLQKTDFESKFYQSFIVIFKAKKVKTNLFKNTSQRISQPRNICSHFLKIILHIYWELLFEVTCVIPGYQIYLKIDCLQRHGHLESTSNIPKFLKSSHFEEKRTENTILKFYLLAEI